jgi:hypothetical protein
MLLDQLVTRLMARNLVADSGHNHGSRRVNHCRPDFISRRADGWSTPGSSHRDVAPTDGTVLSRQFKSRGQK